MFEDVKAHETEDTPYISSLMESRYLIAAVICNDMIRLTNLKVNLIIQNLGYLRYKTLPHLEYSYIFNVHFHYRWTTPVSIPSMLLGL